MNYIDDDDLTSISYLITPVHGRGARGGWGLSILVGYPDRLGNALARSTIYTLHVRKLLDLPSSVDSPWNEQERLDQTAAVTHYLTVVVIGSHICLKGDL